MSSSYEEHVVGGARSLLTPVHSNQQQMAGKSTLKDMKTNNDLDSQFRKLLITIQSHMQVLQQQTQVRVTKWLKKLLEETTNTVWKRNRNSYARLLHEQLRSGGKLRAPFDTLPPDGPLPTLSKHTIYPYKATATITPFNNNNNYNNNTPSSTQSNATSKLDQYLGRHPTITNDHHDAPERHKNNNNNNNNNNTKNNTYTKKLEMYDTYTNTDLHTHLGASWERQQELEWKLKSAEDVINRQAASLYIDHSNSNTRHIGSTNDITPMNGRTYNYYVDTLGGGLELTPVTSGGGDISGRHISSRQRYTSEQLEELLTECNVIRRLRNHHHNNNSSSGNEKSSSNIIIDDDVVVSVVEKFKQGTETIRHRLMEDRGNSGPEMYNTRNTIDGGVKPSSITTGTNIMSKNNKSSKVVIGTEVRHTLKSAAALKSRRAAIIQAGGEGVLSPSLQVDDNSSKAIPLSSSAIRNCHHNHNHNASTITAANVPGYSSDLMSELVDLRRRVQHSISAVVSPLCTTIMHDDDEEDRKYSLSSLLSDDGSKSGGVSGESSPLCCDGDSRGLGVSLNMMLDDDDDV
jgi:hypothetical protein